MKQELAKLEKSKSTNDEFASFVQDFSGTSFNEKFCGRKIWIFDTGASSHMCDDKSLKIN